MATAPEVQIAYLRLWAEDIDAEFNEELSPKAQFTRFAVHVLGWKGGDENWNRRWKECFGEEYSYRPRAPIIVPIMKHSATIAPSMSTFLHAPPEAGLDSAKPTRWTEMEGDDFIAKFEQLSLHKGWSKKEAMRYRTAAIDDDIISNYGIDLTNLAEWQKLCSDVGIEPVPRSITQCKKALKHVLVNLVDLVNYRHLNIPVRQFASMREFREYTRQSGKLFSKKDAKRDGFIKVLLREVYSSRRSAHAPIGGVGRAVKAAA